jgi:hypothetical protein
VNTEIELMMKRLAKRSSGDRMALLAGPYLIHGLPDTYAVATDGRTIVWTRLELPCVFPSLFQADGEAWAKLVRNFAPPDDLLPSWEGPLGELQSFCGAPIWSIECPECKGTSERSEYVRCSFCDDEGSVFPEPRPGVVCGAPMDLNRLAGPLAPFACDTVICVLRDQQAKGPRLWLIAKDLRIAVSMMSEVCNDPDTHPCFPAVVESAKEAKCV